VSRQQRIQPEDLDTDQAALYRSITEGRRSSQAAQSALTDDDGVLRGPFNGFLLAPALGDPLQRLGAAIRYNSGLSERTRELAVLTVAAHWDSTFEQQAHESIGRSIGLTELEIVALRDRQIPTLKDPFEAGCLEVVRALLDGDVCDAVWAEASVELGQKTIFALTTLVGYYATLALQMRVFRIG
jgi:4-carboxymuconolactone decarboxylase